MDTVVWSPLLAGLRFLGDQPMRVGGVALVGVLLLCMVLAFVDTSPNAKILKDWLETRGSRGQAAEQRFAEVKKALDQLQKENEALKGQARHWTEEGIYGQPLADMGQLMEVQRENVVGQIAELLPDTRAMVVAADELWRELTADKPSDTAPLAAVIAVVERQAREPVMRLFNALDEWVKARRDPRALLASFISRYAIWCEWVDRVNRLRQTDLTGWGGYKKWQELELKWREELGKKLEAPNLTAVRVEMANDEQRRRYRTRII